MNIPSHPYVLLDRDILCNCDIEAKNNFMLESLTLCGEHEKPDLEMYFTVNLAFVDYLDQLNETINIPIVRNCTCQMQILPISLESSNINSNLLQAPKTLKEFVGQYKEKRKLMDLQEKTIKEPKFNAFLSSYIANVLVFVAGIISVILTFMIIYMLYRPSKLKSLVASMALHHVKTIEAAALKENENCEFGLITFLIILNLAMAILMVVIKIKKSRVFTDVYSQIWLKLTYL